MLNQTLHYPIIQGWLWLSIWYPGRQVFVPGAPCRWLHQRSPFHQLVIYVKTPPQKDQQRLVGKVSNIHIYLYTYIYLYIYTIYIYMNKAFTLLDSLITKNTQGVTYRIPEFHRVFFGGERTNWGNVSQFSRRCGSWVSKKCEWKQQSGSQGLRCTVMFFLFLYIPGSSKWPRLDPQVTLPGLKWPPLRPWEIKRSVWRSWELCVC